MYIHSTSHHDKSEQKKNQLSILILRFIFFAWLLSQFCRLFKVCHSYTPFSVCLFAKKNWNEIMKKTSGKKNAAEHNRCRCFGLKFLTSNFMIFDSVHDRYTGSQMKLLLSNVNGMISTNTFKSRIYFHFKRVFFAGDTHTHTAHCNHNKLAWRKFE